MYHEGNPNSSDINQTVTEPPIEKVDLIVKCSAQETRVLKGTS